MYFPFQNCQNLFYRTIIIEMTNKNVKQGRKTLLFPFLTPCEAGGAMYAWDYIILPACNCKQI